MSYYDNIPIIQDICYDSYGVIQALKEGENIPENISSEIMSGKDGYGRLQKFTLIEDEQTANLWRVATIGNVSVQVEPPPAGGTKVTMVADTPLAIKKDHDTNYILPNGKTLYIQIIKVGAQGDPTTNGSKAEVIFYNGTEHTIDRIYVIGATKFETAPDVSNARDGTLLAGNGTNYIILRRKRLSTSEQEIDVYLEGYYL